MRKQLLSISLLCMGAAGTLLFGARKHRLPALSVQVAAEEEVAEQPQSSAAEQTPQEAAEQFTATQKRVIAYVEDAITFFEQHSVEESFRAFMHDTKFATGGMSVFVLNQDAILLAKGGSPQQIWRDESKITDKYGTTISRNIVKVALGGGGWVHYQDRNANKIVYARAVKKGGTSYIIGSGFFPHAVRDEVISLVNGAADFFNSVIERKGMPYEAFSTFSYPLGRFVRGSLYLYALDFKGIIVAQGDVPGLIGQSAWDYKDSDGKLVNQEIIAQLKKVPYGKGVWVDYVSKNALKKAYARKVRDGQGKEYFIACGYYPDADRDQVKRLVAEGYRYLKSVGVTQAAQDFSSPTEKKFFYGDLALYLYDMKGNVVAHGNNPTFIGKNHYDMQDEDGVYYVQEIIKKAKENETGGWVNFKLKNSYYSLYVEPVIIGTANLIIASGLYAISRYETMVLLVKSAVEKVSSSTREEAFSEFIKPDGAFSRGDLGIFVLDDTGMCYLFLDNLQFVRKNIMTIKDDNGKEYIKAFIDAAMRDEGKVSYVLNGLKRLAYVERIEKDGRMYIIGSSLYE